MRGAANAETVNGLQIHTLFIGSRDGRTFPDDDRQAIIDATAAAFSCFTIMDADGYFHGRSVATIVIKLGADDTEAVISLSRRLGALLTQQSVGHETAGRFHSIVMD